MICVPPWTTKSSWFMTFIILVNQSTAANTINCVFLYNMNQETIVMLNALPSWPKSPQSALARSMCSTQHFISLPLFYLNITFTSFFSSPSPFLCYVHIFILLFQLDICVYVRKLCCNPRRGKQNLPLITFH